MRHGNSTGLLFHDEEIFAEKIRIATLRVENSRKWKFFLLD